MTGAQTLSVPPVMLLAAGRGSRLQPLTNHTPKPLLPVAGHPLIDHQLRQIERAGARRVVVNSFHLAELLEQHLQQHWGADAQAPGGSTLDLQLSREPELLETGGGILHAQALLQTDEFWVLNGDILMNAPLDQFPRRLPPGEDLHLLLRPTPGYRSHGDFEWQAGRITDRGDSYVYCGFALLSLPALRRYARTLPNAAAEPQVFSLQGFLFDRVAAGRAGGTLHDGYWFDIGTPEQLEAANRFLAATAADS
jgi:MurNAc alpha-1-phosphate uridylyltransferase